MRAPQNLIAAALCAPSQRAKGNCAVTYPALTPTLTPVPALDAISLNGLTIKPGEQVLTRLVVSRLPSGTVIDIPVHVFRSTKPGPTVLLLAGMHGDEVNGIETIRRMIRRELLQPLRGTIIAVPILNIYGFLNFSREVPDGKDVNRSFPGNPRGSLASRVAHRFMREIMPLIDYGIDFHTGGAARSSRFPTRCASSLPSRSRGR